MKRRWWVAIALAVVAVFLLLWLARAYIAVQFARSYFNSHGVTSSVDIGDLGFSGVSGRFSLGPQDVPEISAEKIELRFDPLRWLPYVVEVRLVNPVVRVRLDENGKLTLGSLQDWIDSLTRQQGKSRFVSDDLAVSLTGLRLLLATPGGALEMDGDVKLVKNLPVTLALRARPARIVYRDMDVTLRATSLAFDQKARTLAVQFSGDLENALADVRGVDARVDATGFNWSSADGQVSAAAPSVVLHATAASFAAGQNIAAPKLDLKARNVSVRSSGGKLDAAADLAVTTEVGFDAALTTLQVADPALANAIRQNLAHVALTLAGHAEQRDGIVRFALTQPMTVTGARKGSLRVSALSLSGTPDSLNAALEANLAGPGLPAAKLGMTNLLWTGGGFTGQATLTTHFNFDRFRGVDIATKGTLSWQDGRYAFTPAGCVRLTLAAFHPETSDLAKDLRNQLCAVGNQPLLTGEGASWKLTGAARDISADFPLANARMEKAAANLDFEGEGAPLRGTATFTAAQMLDKLSSSRFKPLYGTGTISLADGVWRGRFAVTDPHKTALGETVFEHNLAAGTGTAHINAPHIAFKPDGLQPEGLSALLVALRRAEGTVALTGDINWTRAAITSQGKLSILALDFMTPLGKAHAVKSDITLTSLLPPSTAPGQALTIARIDWTLPLSAVDVRFGFTPAALRIAKADTDIAQGHVALGAMDINMADPGHLAGEAQLTAIALNNLIAASNLGSKLKLEGKVSGHIPFALTAEGFRITNGHIEADGPGRLSVNRSLWAQGDAALSSNAVQDFAYQALENLAFEQMSADLNSVANGRLQIVFHIKGRSDPPNHQVAEVAITDIINGTALYKPIPLPSGTPIDLTLDTSLNFDELLKSYAEAWSKSLSPEGHPDSPAGAKP